MPKLLVSNWKSNKTPVLAEQWCQHFSTVHTPTDVSVVVVPGTSLIPTVASHLPEGFELGAQDVSPFPMGSYTGAVNAQQLQAAGVQYVIVGHSERRRYFHETHQDVASKLQQIVSAQLTPILCLDEEYIDTQVAALETTSIPNLIVAYEPIAAIGTGNNAPVDTVTAVVEKIRNTFGQVPVIYGGSVDETNIKEYMLVSDGVLIGAASLDPVQFEKVMTAASVS